MKKILGLIIAISVITPKANAFDWRAQLEQLKEKAVGEVGKAFGSAGISIDGLKDQATAAFNSKKDEFASTARGYYDSNKESYKNQAISRGKQFAADARSSLSTRAQGSTAQRAASSTKNRLNELKARLGM